MIVFFLGSLGFLALLLAVVHAILKRGETYKIASNLSGDRLLPVVGNLFQFIRLSPEQSFNFLRRCARLYGKSHRFWFFGVLHFNAIRARDLEVSCILFVCILYICYVQHIFSESTIKFEEHHEKRVVPVSSSTNGNRPTNQYWK